MTTFKLVERNLRRTLYARQAKIQGVELHDIWNIALPGTYVRVNPQFFLPLRGRWPNCCLPEMLRNK